MLTSAASPEPAKPAPASQRFGDGCRDRLHWRDRYRDLRDPPDLLNSRCCPRIPGEGSPPPSPPRAFSCADAVRIAERLAIVGRQDEHDVRKPVAAVAFAVLSAGEPSAAKPVPLLDPFPGDETAAPGPVAARQKPHRPRPFDPENLKRNPGRRGEGRQAAVLELTVGLPHVPHIVTRQRPVDICCALL